MTDDRATTLALLTQSSRVKNVVGHLQMVCQYGGIEIQLFPTI